MQVIKKSREGKVRLCFPIRWLPRRSPVRSLEALESRILLSSTWFVATTGLNSNPGTLAAPFQTIQQAANVAGPGDTVDVLGGVYHETVTVQQSGTAAAPIIFQPYQNQTVIVDGADPVAGWTNSSGSIYTANMPQDLGPGNNQVFIDGQPMNDARWPNASFDLSHPVMATIASATGVSASQATIQDAHLTQPAGFWVGATIHMGLGQNWVFQTGTVTASGPGFVTFSYTLHNAKFQLPTKGNPYYLTSVSNALDSAGEWFRSSDGTLSLWTPASDDPTNHAVEVKSRQYGFDVSAASYIQINGINFFACSVNTSSHSTGVVLNGITAHYVSQFSVDVNGFALPAQSGIVLAGNGDVIENSTIADSAGDGVYVAGANDVVTNNVIHDIDYAGFNGAPVHIVGVNDTISYNTCYNAARDGLLFNGSHATITNNDVYNYGLQTTDLGGFYAAWLNGNGTVIAYNKFHDCYTAGFGGQGIMFDNNCSGFIVHHNIVWHVNDALRFVGSARRFLVVNNTLDARTWSVDTKGSDWATTILENNIFTRPLSLGTRVTLSHNLTNNGRFVNASAGDFHLLAGAPAIGAGMKIPPYTNGFLGKAPDVGALAYKLPDFGTGALLSEVAVLPMFPIMPPPST